MYVTVYTIASSIHIKFFAPQMRCLFEGGAYSKIGRGKKKTLKKCKKCKLMIIVVNALSYPWYCLTTDQLFHRRATQTNETNIVNET